MIGVFGRQKREVFALKADTVSVAKIWIVALFAAACFKIDRAACFVDIRDAPNCPFAAGNTVFELAGRQIIEI